MFRGVVRIAYSVDLPEYAIRNTQYAHCHLGTDVL